MAGVQFSVPYSTKYQGPLTDSTVVSLRETYFRTCTAVKIKFQNNVNEPFSLSKKNHKQSITIRYLANKLVCKFAVSINYTSLKPKQFLEGLFDSE
jgi:hypothetical protein